MLQFKSKVRAASIGEDEFDSHSDEWVIISMLVPERSNTTPACNGVA
jgi:hypothetical protein